MKAGDGINPRGAGKYTSDDSRSCPNDHLLRTSAVRGRTVLASRTSGMRSESQSSDPGNRAVKSRGND